MSKQLLQGIAIGIFLTTMVLAYQIYFTKQLHVNGIEEQVPLSQDFEFYLESNQLVVLTQTEYEQLLDKITVLEEAEKYVEEEPIYQEVTLTIKPGMNSSEVGELLETNQLIDNRSLFEEYIKDNHLETKIRAGEYQLSSEMSLEDIVAEISLIKYND